MLNTKDYLPAIARISRLLVNRNKGQRITGLQTDGYARSSCPRSSRIFGFASYLPIADFRVWLRRFYPPVASRNPWRPIDSAVLVDVDECPPLTVRALVSRPRRVRAALDGNRIAPGSSSGELDSVLSITSDYNLCRDRDRTRYACGRYRCGLRRWRGNRCWRRSLSRNGWRYPRSLGYLPLLGCWFRPTPALHPRWWLSG